MLGVRRAGIWIALQDLEERHLIETSRTVVSVLDRQASLNLRAVYMESPRGNLDDCSRLKFNESHLATGAPVV